MTIKIPVLLSAIALFSCLYHIVALLCTFLFSRQKSIRGKRDTYPKVSCLKPLCGYDKGAEKNLESFIYQDYPDYEVVFGVKDRDDPAYRVALKIAHKFPDKEIKVVVGEKGKGANRKVRNLRNIYDHISQDSEILVLSDSDTRVSEDYLAHMVDPIVTNPEVAVVTSIYRIDQMDSPGDMVEALAVETTFVPGVMVTEKFSDLEFAFGASIAVDRASFMEVGGFEAIEDYLADDFKIGNLICRGKPDHKGTKESDIRRAIHHSLDKSHPHRNKVRLSSYVVPIVPPGEGLASEVSHIIRWNRTVRICKPVGYFLSVACHACFWALLSFIANMGTRAGLSILAITCLIRVTCAAGIISLIRSKSGISKALLTPLWDIMATILWAAALVGNRVTWRGTRYKILPGGQLQEIDNHRPQKKP